MIVLTEEIKRRLADALTDGHPVVAGYVDREGDPHISFYGSVHAYSDDQLALWVRNADGELLAAIGRNPKIGFVYSDMSTRTFYRMYGRGRVESDPRSRVRRYASVRATAGSGAQGHRGGGGPGHRGRARRERAVFDGAGLRAIPCTECHVGSWDW